jgi:hypothetical protein
VAAPPQRLEALVRDELRGPVSEIVEQVVRELVREQLNGTTPLPVEATAAPSANGATEAPSTKVCRICGETKPASAFETGRLQCRTCRGRRYPRNGRARGTVTAPAVDEEPPQPGARGRGADLAKKPPTGSTRDGPP